MSRPHDGVPAKSGRLRIASLTALAACLTLASCAAPPRGPAVPQAQVDQAVVLDMPAIRTWGNVLSPAFAEELFRAARREIELRQAGGATDPLPPAEFLAISGGGANGAFGAGLLCGWTAAGTRPAFKAVTGISTGALTAPFAFLGSKYDAKLQEVYTKVTTKQIARQRSLLSVMGSDSLADTAPLRSLLRETLPPAMIREIAEEYDRGRILLIGTTNLDAQRGVIWNIGAIAARNRPEADDLIYDILIASAAIPAAFPPVMIDVNVDGQAYQEMHVDGGTRAQVFLYPPSLRVQDVPIQRQRRAYVIRNARLQPTWKEVPRRVLPIASRAIDSLIETQGIGDLYMMYLTTQRDAVDFNLAIIPADFAEIASEAFDPVYMQKLFDIGYNAAKAGYPWLKTPPGYVGTEAAPQVMTRP